MILVYLDLASKFSTIYFKFYYCYSIKKSSPIGLYKSSVVLVDFLCKKGEKTK